MNSLKKIIGMKKKKKKSFLVFSSNIIKLSFLQI